MTTAYFVGLISIRNEAKWQEYVAQVGSTIVQYGGDVVFRGVKRNVNPNENKSNEPNNERVVTLQFADVESAKRWHESPEYQRLIPIRDLGAQVTLTLYSE